MSQNVKPEAPKRIEELKKKLYSPEGPGHKHGNNTLRTVSDIDVPTDWEYKEKPMPKKKRSIINTVFIIALTFFLGALGFAFFSMQSGFNTISPDNIALSVSGPTTTKAGDTLELEVSVRNHNETPMQEPILFVEFPEGSRSPENTDNALNRLVLPLEDIASGERAEQLVKLVLFGQEGDKKTLTLGVEYRVPGSGATFYVDKTYEIEINEAPLKLDIQGPQDISSGQEMTLKVLIASEADHVLENVLLVAEYPFGFEFISAPYKPTFDNNVWLLGDIEPGKTEEITVHGRISGQRDEERIFRFEIGTQSPRNEKLVGTPFATYSQSIVLRKPLVDLSVLLAGESKREHVVGSSAPVRVDITWKNNTEKALQGVEITADLGGPLYDPSAVSVSRGQYRRDTGKIIWNENTEPRFSTVAAGESGTVSFEFIPRPIEEDSGTMDIDVGFKGSASGNTIEVSRTTTLSVASTISLQAEALSTEGIIPPEEGGTTEYKVTMRVHNSFNEVGDVEVVATLPTYVEWKNETRGDGEFEYSQVGGRVTWILGNLSPNKEALAEFIVEVTPTAIGEISLVENIQAKALDLSTQTALEARSADIVINVE